jgi:hypothetical protein
LARNPSFFDLINENLINGALSWNAICWMLSGGGHWQIYHFVMSIVIVSSAGFFWFKGQTGAVLKVFLLFNPFYFFDWVVVTRIYTLVWSLSLVGFTLTTIKNKKDRHRISLIFVLGFLMSLSLWGMLCSFALVLGQIKLRRFNHWLHERKLIIATLISFAWFVPHLIALALVYGSDYQGGLVAENQNNRIVLTGIKSKMSDFVYRISIFSFGQIREDYNLWNKKAFPWYIPEPNSGIFMLILLSAIFYVIYNKFGVLSLAKFCFVFFVWTMFNVLVYMGFERHFYYFAFAPLLALTSRRVDNREIIKQTSQPKRLGRLPKNKGDHPARNHIESSGLSSTLLRISTITTIVMMVPAITYTVKICLEDRNQLFSAAAWYGKRLDKSRTYVVLNSSLYPSLLLDNDLKIISLFGPAPDKKVTVPPGIGFNKFDRSVVYGGEKRSERLGLICNLPLPTLVTTGTSYRVIKNLPGADLPVLEKTNTSMVTDEGDLVLIDLKNMCDLDSSLRLFVPHIN